MNNQDFFKAHTNALLRDYKQYNADLIEKQKKGAFLREVFAGFVLTGIGLFIGYLIAAAF